MLILSLCIIVSSGGADVHVDLLKKLQTSSKLSQKTIQKLSRELAEKLALELNANENPENFYSLHRSDGVDVDFANTFLRVAKTKKPVFFFITLTDGIDSKNGSLMINGNVEDVTLLGPQICEILGGKGNGKNNRFQGKVTQLNKVKDCESLIKKHFECK